MRLSYLLQDIVLFNNIKDYEVTGLALDSRKVKSGNIFFVLNQNPEKIDYYIHDAIARGASFILVEHPLSQAFSVPVISLKHLAKYVGVLAARFYDYPSHDMAVIGVTGTSGKTSCTQFIAQILAAMNLSCGVVGTLGAGLWGQLVDTGFTTPDAVSLQLILRQLRDHLAQVVAMEVSSHSIEQSRIAGVEFTIGLFTNLSQDHLDYHGDMHTYAAVKKQFFIDYPMQHIIFNADDAYTKKWLPTLPNQQAILTYSTQSKADIFVEEATFTLDGMMARIQSTWGQGKVHVPLIGQFNLSNLLGAIAALCAYGLPFQQVLQAVAMVQPVAGRMQILGGQLGRPLVVVDYAHKPGALLNVLQTLRKHCTSGRLICVFGCGGERDQEKRPLMGEIAENYADYVILTNDNPRHEDPSKIINQIKAGFKQKDNYIVELDRAKAIEKGIQYAQAKDCVVIAGKGCENYQLIGDQKLSFDDVEQVKFFLQAYPISR